MRVCEARIVATVKLLPGQGQLLPNPSRYKRLVGKLNYLTITQLHIHFTMSVCSQFLDSPRDSHRDAFVWILKYIKEALGIGLLYTNRGHVQIISYTNADWEGSPSNKRLTSGYCILIGGNLIPWKSKKQSAVTRLSAKAKYQPVALGTCDLYG